MLVKYISMITTAIALAGAASMKDGFILPRDQPDGLYLGSFNDKGVAEYQYLGPPSARPSSEIEASPKTVHSAKLRKRGETVFDSPGKPLYCSKTVVGSDSKRAKDALVQKCRANLPVKGMHVVVARVGSAIAYYCNFLQSIQHCTKDGVTDSFDYITQRCLSNEHEAKLYLAFYNGWRSGKGTPPADYYWDWAHGYGIKSAHSSGGLCSYDITYPEQE